jgi:hypothetical protein
MTIGGLVNRWWACTSDSFTFTTHTISYAWPTKFFHLSELCHCPLPTQRVYMVGYFFERPETRLLNVSYAGRNLNLI